MAISWVRTYSGAVSGASGTVFTFTLPAAVGAGNALLFVAFSATNLVSVTDNAGVGNKYKIWGAVAYDSYSTNEALVTATNVKGAPTVLTLTFSGTEAANTPSVTGDEYSGKNVQVNTTAGPTWLNGSLGSPVGINITPTVNNCTIWGFMNDDTGTVGVGSGYTIRNAGITEDLAQTTAATISVSFTQSGSVQGPVIAGVALFELLFTPRPKKRRQPRAPLRFKRRPRRLPAVAHPTTFVQRPKKKFYHLPLPFTRSRPRHKIAPFIIPPSILKFIPKTKKHYRLPPAPVRKPFAPHKIGAIAEPPRGAPAAVSWSSIQKNSHLSGGGTVTLANTGASGIWYTGFLNTSLTVGKWYWEGRVTSTGGSFFAIALGNTSTSTADNTFPGIAGDSIGVDAAPGGTTSLLWNGAIVYTVSSFVPASADWYIAAIDLNNKLFWWRNVTQGSGWFGSSNTPGDPVAGTGGFDLTQGTILAHPVVPAIASVTNRDVMDGFFQIDPPVGPAGYIPIDPVYVPAPLKIRTPRLKQIQAPLQFKRPRTYRPHPIAGAISPRPTAMVTPKPKRHVYRLPLLFKKPRRQVAATAPPRPLTFIPKPKKRAKLPPFRFKRHLPPRVAAARPLTFIPRPKPKRRISTPPPIFKRKKFRRPIPYVALGPPGYIPKPKKRVHPILPLAKKRPHKIAALGVARPLAFVSTPKKRARRGPPLRFKQKFRRFVWPFVPPVPVGYIPSPSPKKRIHRFQFRHYRTPRPYKSAGMLTGGPYTPITAPKQTPGEIAGLTQGGLLPFSIPVNHLTTDPNQVTMAFTQLVGGLNNWVAKAAAAINSPAIASYTLATLPVIARQGAIAIVSDAPPGTRLRIFFAGAWIVP